MASLPTSPHDRRVRFLAWLNLLGNLLIIGTGGAVRLTGSGLGCPTWPTCTADSFVNTPEMGIHGVIEFGNRTLSPVLGVLAVLLVVATWRLPSVRPLALVILGGVVAQAVVGGVTVLTGLNSWIVGFHYLASVLLVVIATFVVLRSTPGHRQREHSLPGWVRAITKATVAVLTVVLVLGVLTTGSGPHSGDESALRSGFAWDVLAHVHAYAAYALVATLLALLIAASRGQDRGFLRAVILVSAAVAVQIVVGVVQSNAGLPPILVGVHMVLAAITAALTVLVADAARRPLRKPAL